MSAEEPRVKRKWSTQEKEILSEALAEFSDVTEAIHYVRDQLPGRTYDSLLKQARNIAKSANTAEQPSRKKRTPVVLGSSRLRHQPMFI